MNTKKILSFLSFLLVMLVSAVAFAQPEGAWKPFAPRGWWLHAYRAATHAAMPL